ncbi:MAG: hypothetical protein AAF543_01280 [Pseudomonadota bacterium]
MKGETLSIGVQAKRRREPVHPRSGRLARSAACRNWYRWRAGHATTPPPHWIAIAPPWPVIRLACRMKGKSPWLAALGLPLALLASADGDYPEDAAIDRTPRVKSPSRSARLFRSIGIGPSSA